MNWFKPVVAYLASAVLLSTSAETATPMIGVYYFPGWGVESWKKIQPYPEREPQIGWYKVDDTSTMDRQLQMMSRAGIDFVAFDWYHKNHIIQGDPVAYLGVHQSRVKMALAWADDNEVVTPEVWREIVEIWLQRYFHLSNYLKINGKPLIIVISYQKLQRDAKNSGTTLRSYLDTANKMAEKEGFPSLYLVAGMDDTSSVEARVTAKADGFSAVSAYNYQRSARGSGNPHWDLPSHGYAGLDQDYREQWAEAQKNDIPYIVPMSSGWDKRPWGGSGDALHDNSIATAEQFYVHLSAARAIIEKNGPAHSGIGIICCWNEFGEGSFVEPTKKDGDMILQKVGEVFSK